MKISPEFYPVIASGFKPEQAEQVMATGLDGLVVAAHSGAGDEG